MKIAIMLAACWAGAASAAVIPGAAMRSTALAALRTGDPTLVVEADEPEAVPVPEEGCRLRAGEVPAAASGVLRVPVRISCPSGLRMARTVWVKARRQVPVAVAARPLRRGERLRREDLSEDMRWEDAPGGRGLGLETAVGRELLRPLPAGGIVTDSAARVVPDVRLGERIYIQVLAGPLTVRAAAVALRDGYLGDSIEARTVPGGKVVAGRVTQGGTLEIDMGRSRR